MNMQLPTDKERRYMVLKAYALLLSINANGEFLGTGGNIKISFGDAVREHLQSDIDFMKKVRELGIEEVKQLMRYLVDNLKEIVKGLAKEFEYQVINLSREKNIVKLAKHLAEKMINNIADGKMVEDKMITLNIIKNPKESYLYAQLLHTVY